MTAKRRSICANCGWHRFKHGDRSQCPNMPRKPDGSKHRYEQRKDNEQ